MFFTPPDAAPAAPDDATPKKPGVAGAIELRLLNGQTKDFDGTTPTTNIPAPENPHYADDIAAAGGLTNLGVCPLGQGRANSQNDAYTVITQAAAKVPNIPRMQYQWQRFITRRSWYIRKNTDGTRWLVNQRSSRGTTSPADDATNTLAFNTTPTSSKREIYFADTSATVYAFQTDVPGVGGLVKVGDYIHEEKAFTYKVRTSLDGTNWAEGARMDVAHVINVRYKDPGNAPVATAMRDWEGVPNLQGGNQEKEGKVNPVIDEKKVRAIVGGGLPIDIDQHAND